MNMISKRPGTGLKTGEQVWMRVEDWTFSAGKFMTKDGGEMRLCHKVT